MEELSKTEAKEIYRKTLVKMESGEICWDDNKLELMSTQIDDMIDEQTFFNNGQFNEDELDLINWGLNDLLQVMNKTAKEANGTDFLHFNEVMQQVENIENLIEKIQEGS